MGMKISTGLADAMLATGSAKSALTGMVMKIFGGTEPATANDSIGAATLLVTITESDDGVTALEFEAAAVAGVLEKSSAQVWEGTVAATGVATFFRLQLPADANGTSTTAVRIQGDCALAGAFLNLTSTSLTIAAPQRVGNFAIALPLQ